MINSYNDLEVSNLQQVRLYLQSRPLMSLYRRKRKCLPYTESEDVQAINKLLTGDYVAIDCAGWYFANSERSCTAIELQDISKKIYPSSLFEYDYLTWHPTYLKDVTVLAYYSSYFKYSTLDDFVTFCNIWGQEHNRLIIGLDPTRVKFNYLKYNLLTILKERLEFPARIMVITAEHNNLLFTIEPA